MSNGLYYVRDNIWRPTSGSDITPGEVDVTHGSQVDETNTGPRTSLTPQSSWGSVLMSQSWLDANNGGSNIISGLQISDAGFNFGSACATIPSKKVIIRDCELLGVGWANASVWFNTAMSGNDIPADFTVQVEYCKIDGQDQVTSSIAETVFTGGQISVRRCEVTNICGMTRNYSDNWSVTECYVHNLAAVPEGGASPHTGCITVLSGHNITIARNKAFTINDEGVENDNIGATGAIVLLCRQQGDSDQITVQDNAMQGGSYSLYCGASGPYNVTNASFTGNVFYRDFRRLSGQYGPDTSFGNDPPEETNVWSNNTWGPLGPSNLVGDPAEGTQVVPQ